MAIHTQPATPTKLDIEDLRGKVQHMYEAVARHPHDGYFHFEMGRALAERLRHEEHLARRDERGVMSAPPLIGFGRLPRSKCVEAGREWPPAPASFC